MGVISSKIGKICMWQWVANLLFRPRFRMCDSSQGAMSLQYKLTCKFLLLDHFLVPADAIHTFGLRSKFATHSTIITLFADRFAVYFKGIPIFLMIIAPLSHSNRLRGCDKICTINILKFFNILVHKPAFLTKGYKGCYSLTLLPYLLLLLLSLPP